jgi:unsaturated rhamnogalacturonyl hydrolase
MRRQMERRQFMKTATVSAGAAMAVASAAGTGLEAGEEPAAASAATIEKVKMAMLAMQREAWEQGVAAQALLELGETDLVVLMAKGAVLRQFEDGRLGQVSDNHGVTDPAANGEAVLHAARVLNDPALKAAADRMLDYLIKKAPRTKDGVLHHIDHKPQVWVDSMYMGPPFLAVAGRPDEAVKQVEGFHRILWNREKKLYSAIWDDGLGKFDRQDCWGVGNGWAAAGMTRVVQALPASMAADRERLIGYVREVIDGCLAHQRKDGLFHNVVDDPRSFVETNLAQMLAYSIYRGTKAGWLPASYRAQAGRMRSAAEGKVDARGYVQDVCGSPTFQAPGVATEGQAFFLLMHAAARA